MVKSIENIHSGDVFIYNDIEMVAIDDYIPDNNFIWVTIRKYFIDEKRNVNGHSYGYTNASIIEINRSDMVEYIGNMNNL